MITTLRELSTPSETAMIGCLRQAAHDSLVWAGRAGLSEALVQNEVQKRA